MSQMFNRVVEYTIHLENEVIQKHIQLKEMT